MIGFDTNVLLRALFEDDKVQSKIAQQHLSALSPELPGFVSTGVQLELYWVFERRYRMGRADIVAAFATLIEVSTLVFEDLESLARALHLYRVNGADLSDALIAERNRKQGCEQTLTFDKIAARSIPDKVLLT